MECAAMRFVPVRPMGMKLGTVVGGKGLLFQKVTRGQRLGQISSCWDWAQIWGGWCYTEGECEMSIEEDAHRGEVKSKVRSNFRLLELSSDLGRVMLDRGQVHYVYRGGRAYYFKVSNLHNWCTNLVSELCGEPSSLWWYHLVGGSIGGLSRVD